MEVTTNNNKKSTRKTRWRTMQNDGSDGSEVLRSSRNKRAENMVRGFAIFLRSPFMIHIVGDSLPFLGLKDAQGCWGCSWGEALGERVGRTWGEPRKGESHFSHPPPVGPENWRIRNETPVHHRRPIAIYFNKWNIICWFRTFCSPDWCAGEMKICNVIRNGARWLELASEDFVPCTERQKINGNNYGAARNARHALD